jgi:hypothetical protein
MKSEVSRHMNPFRLTVWRAALGLGALALAAAGCGPPSPKLHSRDVIPPGEAELKQIASLYLEYTKHNGNKSPATAEQLKAWAKGQPKDKLTELGIEDVDKVFISPRDNQPFVVIPKTGPGPGRVIAYEATGVKGKRYVAAGQGSVREVSEETFRGMLPQPSQGTARSGTGRPERP